MFCRQLLINKITFKLKTNTSIKKNCIKLIWVWLGGTQNHIFFYVLEKQTHIHVFTKQWSNPTTQRKIRKTNQKRVCLLWVCKQRKKSNFSLCCVGLDQCFVKTCMCICFPNTSKNMSFCLPPSHTHINLMQFFLMLVFVFNLNVILLIKSCLQNIDICTYNQTITFLFKSIIMICLYRRCAPILIQNSNDYQQV